VSNIFFKANWREMERDTKHLMDAYRQLAPSIARKHLQASMRRAVKPFAPALKAATPKDTGSLRRSVKVIVRYYKKADHGSVAGMVGFGRGSKTKNKMGNHSSIVENGTKLRRRKSGASCGRMPARKMVAQTLNSLGQGILKNIVTELGVGLERAARDLGRPGGK
jgi:HK97 gp10 family phage protein